jgi:hypothetical protein
MPKIQPKSPSATGPIEPSERVGAGSDSMFLR